LVHAGDGLIDENITAADTDADPGVKLWKFCRDSQMVEWDWATGMPDIQRLSPVRSPASSALSRHIPVQGYSQVAGASLDFESGLEFELMLTLDRLPTTRHLVSQPFRLTWLDGVWHVPDLLSVDSEGEVTVWDARAEDRQDDRFLSVSQRTARACADVGWHFQVFPGLSSRASLNLRWLSGARRRPEWLSTTKDLVRSVVQDGAVIGDVMDGDDSGRHLTASMWHLMWTGQIAVDLNERWTRNTSISWHEATN
jgi:hypothetical protein